MKIAFFKTANFRDVLLAWLTLGPYSHCEFLFSDWQCCGATPINNAGVRFAPAAEVLTNLSKWYFLDLPLKASEEEHLRTWCSGEVGCPYDWNDIFRFGLKFLPEDPNAWFCSELCLAGLQQIGMFKGLTCKLCLSDLQQIGMFSDLKACNYSPNRLYKILVASGFKPGAYSS